MRLYRSSGPKPADSLRCTPYQSMANYLRTSQRKASICSPKGRSTSMSEKVTISGNGSNFTPDRDPSRTKPPSRSESRGRSFESKRLPTPQRNRETSSSTSQISLRPFLLTARMYSAHGRQTSPSLSSPLPPSPRSCMSRSKPSSRGRGSVQRRLPTCARSRPRSSGSVTGPHPMHGWSRSAD